MNLSKGAREKFFCLVFGLCYFSFVQPLKPTFQPVYQWTQLEFDYPTEHDRNQDIQNGNFIPGQPASIDVDVYYSENNLENKVFITAPKFQSGVPVTLGVVTNRTRGNNPIIAPYPDWSWHRDNERCNPKRIVSVYRVQIDECDRLWILDTGRLLENQTCPPQLLAFDLKTNRLITKYELPSDQYLSNSIFVTPAVDVRATCRDTFVYLADCQWNSLVVYDFAHQTSWHIIDKTFYPYPNYGTFKIAGEQFDLMDGILGLALSPYVQGEDRKLFYHAMSSPTENWVYTSQIRNRTRFLQNPSPAPEIFRTFKFQRTTQSGPEATDKTGVVFFGLMSDLSIGCWNSREEYGLQSTDIVDRNATTLQFASGIKVIKNKKGVQEVWVLTSRFQKLATGTLTPKEVNFRIQAAKVDDLLYGTKCRRGHHHQQQHTGPPQGGGYGWIPKPKSR